MDPFLCTHLPHWNYLMFLNTFLFPQRSCLWFELFSLSRSFYSDVQVSSGYLSSRKPLLIHCPSWFKILGTSLVAEWLRIRLPMQGARVRALVQEDPTCRGATKPMCRNYWACAPQLLKPARLEKPPQWEAHAPQQRVAPPLAATRESPRTATKTQCSQ